MAQFHHTQIRQAAKLGVELVHRDDDDKIQLRNPQTRQLSQKRFENLAEALNEARNGVKWIGSKVSAANSSPPSVPVQESASSGEGNTWDSVMQEAAASNTSQDSGFEPLTEKSSKTRTIAGSVISSKYRHKYGKVGGSGDQIDAALRDANEGSSGGNTWRAVGTANGVWNDRWDSLNSGMQRMNLANRLRGLLRKNPNAEITIGEVTGRFGNTP